MSAADQPAEWEPTPSEAKGFRAFWGGWSLGAMKGDAERRGWWRAWARAYGAGVKASARWATLPPGPERDALEIPPYPEFSGAWEAWGDGYNEESGL